MTYASAFSQRVSLNLKNVSLERALERLSKQTGVDIAYSSEVIKGTRKVSVDSEDSELEAVLDNLLEGTDIEYRTVDGKIYLSPIQKTSAVAQTIASEDVVVKGSVADASGNPIVGANIVIVGTTTGCVTDIDGHFTLSAPAGSKLRVSFIGYIAQEFAATSTTDLKIVLKEDTQSLEEVVVTGYGGTQLRSKMTNSIAKVDQSTLSTGAHTNPAQALSGAVAGLRVQQNSGNPNATPTLVLRGGTNLDGSGSPLVIIDGTVRESLGDVNPEDIESMEVMKDAGATAIYGARASNGVILVTTKRGSEGHTEVSLKAKVGFNIFHSQYDLLNARDYLYYIRSGYKRAHEIWQDSDGNWYGFAGDKQWNSLFQSGTYGIGNKYFDENGGVLDGNKSGDAVWGVMEYTPDLAILLKKGWQTMDDPVTGKKLIFCDNASKDYNINTPAITQDYNISVSGGNDRGHYYAGLGYNHSEGNIRYSWYQRMNFIVNADYKIKPWLTSNSTLTFSDMKWDDGGAASPNVNEHNYFGIIAGMPPTFRVKNEDGDWLGGFAATSGWATGWSSAGVYKNARHFDNNKDKLNLGQAFTFHILDGLTFKVNGSWFYFDDNRETFRGDYIRGIGPSYNTNHSTSNRHERLLDQTYNGLLNYKTTFLEDHSVDAMVGMEYYDSYKKGFYAGGWGSPLPDFQDLEYTKNGEEDRDIDSWHARQRIMSFFGRVNYDYKAKYLLSFVLRSDGYSKLAKDNRWSTFPGVSLGWVLSKENFMESTRNVLSFAKVRASYGANGNVAGVLDADDNLQSGLDYYTVQGSYPSIGTYNGNTSLMVKDIPNPGMKWEKSYTFETGFDVGFLDNKYVLNFTYYNRHTKNKFANITLPSHSGISSVLSNNGEVENQGIELELTANILRTKDWKVSVSANAAYNKNKIVSLPYNGLPKNRQNAYEVYTGHGNEKKWVGGFQEGEEYGVIYGFKAEGIYKSYDEIKIKRDETKSVDTGNGSDGKVLYGPQEWANLSDADKKGSDPGTLKALPIQPGDVKWKDVNGDGVIDDFDRVKIGNTIPRWTGGININAAWKGLALNCRMDYALGYWIYDYQMMWIMGCMQGEYNSISEVKKSWSETNPNGKYPAYVWADQLGKRNLDRVSTLNCFRGNYLAFREISLSYSLPQNWVHRVGLNKVDVSVTGQNLGYLTAADNMATPEYGTDNHGAYPLPRTVVLGLNVTF